MSSIVIVFSGSHCNTSPSTVGVTALVVIVFIFSVVFKVDGLLHRLVGLEEVGDPLLAFKQDLDQIRGDLHVFVFVVEGSCETFVSDTRGTACWFLVSFLTLELGLWGSLLTNAVNVLGNSTMQSTRKIEINNVHDVLDIQTASRNARGDENRASSGAEGTPVVHVRKSGLIPTCFTNHLQSVFTFTLSTVRVNRSAGQAHVEQIVIQEIGLGFRVDENQGTRGGHREKKVVEALLLQAILGVDDLRKVCMSVLATTRDY